MPSPYRRVILVLRRFSRPLVLSTCLVLASISAWAIVTELASVATVHNPVAEHIDQAELNALTGNAKFTEAFEVGDELFAAAFNALDGGGANVGRGQRYTRVPRADMRGTSEWFNHKPNRVTGPNGAGCFECHEAPFEDGPARRRSTSIATCSGPGSSASSSSATRRMSSRQGPSSALLRR